MQSSLTLWAPHCRTTFFSFNCWHSSQEAHCFKKSCKHKNPEEIFHEEAKKKKKQEVNLVAIMCICVVETYFMCFKQVVAHKMG